MYIFGKNVAKEALNTNQKITRAYISKTFQEQALIQMLRNEKIKTLFVDKAVLDRKVEGNHQGINKD